jgi:hypothetical protein
MTKTSSQKSQKGQRPTSFWGFGCGKNHVYSRSPSSIKKGAQVMIFFYQDATTPADLFCYFRMTDMIPIPTKSNCNSFVFLGRKASSPSSSSLCSSTYFTD